MKKFCSHKKPNNWGFQLSFNKEQFKNSITYLSRPFSPRQNRHQIQGLNCQKILHHCAFAFSCVHVGVHNKMTGLLRHSKHCGRIDKSREEKAWQKAILVAWSSWLMTISKTWLSVEKTCNCVVYSKGYMPANYMHKSQGNN